MGDALVRERDSHFSFRGNGIIELVRAVDFKLITGPPDFTFITGPGRYPEYRTKTRDESEECLAPGLFLGVALLGQRNISR